MEFYKHITSRGLRFKMLKALSFVPDSIMLRCQYRLKMGITPDFNSPRRFTEKLQLYKMFYRNPAMPLCVDKYEVRKYLGSRGFGHLLNTLYGVYDRAEDIDFTNLPDRFVIKTTDGSGGNNVLICKNKSDLHIPQTIKLVNSWLNIKSVNAGREWAYTGIDKSRIIIEEFLENGFNSQSGPDDFKFFCFDGNVYCMQLDIDRYTNHTRNIYDRDYNLLNVVCTYPNNANYKLNLSETQKRRLIKIAEALSEGFPFVRVDLYVIADKIYFGELTFYPGSGYEAYDPDEFDFTLGEKFDIASFCKPHRD